LRRGYGDCDEIEIHRIRKRIRPDQELPECRDGIRRWARPAAAGGGHAGRAAEMSRRKGLPDVTIYCGRANQCNNTTLCRRISERMYSPNRETAACRGLLRPGRSWELGGLAAGSVSAVRGGPQRRTPAAGVRPVRFVAGCRNRRLSGRGCQPPRARSPGRRDACRGFVALSSAGATGPVPTRLRPRPKSHPAMPQMSRRETVRIETPARCKAAAWPCRWRRARRPARSARRRR
jgi:hypothetical protein